jgi:hypothetical protein
VKPGGSGSVRGWIWRYLFGLIGLTGGLGTLWYEAVAFTYLPVEATVIASRVHASDTSKGTRYRPDIRYAYAVGGASYESNRVRRIDFGMNWSSWAESDVRRFPAGSRVGAWYDSADPSVAVLVRTIGFFTWFLFLISAIGFVMPFLWGLHARSVNARLKP